MPATTPWNEHLLSRLLLVLLAVAFCLAAPSAVSAQAPPVENCLIDFDSVCPNVEGVCQTRFRGGVGCVVDGEGDCYDSGLFSYRLDAGENGTMQFRGGVTTLEIFFVHFGEGEGGRIRFFDAKGLQTGELLSTNGDCADGMPAVQVIEFDRPAVRANIRALDTRIYIDSMLLNP